MTRLKTLSSRVSAFLLFLGFFQISQAQIIFPDCPENETVCIDDNTCAVDFLVNQPLATTQCTIGSNIVYSYQSDFGSGDLPDVGATISDLPKGIHEIIVKTEDECSNSAWCNYEVEVKDCKNPTPYCKTGLIAELMSSVCEVTIWAQDLDAGSFDNCPGDIKMSFSSDINDITRVFNTDNLGQNNVEIWVTDEAGNQDFCVTVLIVEDNSNCMGDPNNLTVSGRFTRFDGSPIENAKAFCLSCSPTDLMFSDADGFYEFTGIPSGGDYFILPDKESPTVDGVTVLDLIKIRSHILAVDVMDPNRLLASDVNGSGGTTTFDIVMMQRLILGIDTTFSNVPSWKFQPGGIQLNNLTDDELFADFLGIKMGDVILESEVPTVDFHPKFIMEAAQLTVGNSANLGITVEEFDNLIGFQFGIKYDPNVLSYISPSFSGAILPGFSQSSVFMLEPGHLTVLWLNPNPTGHTLNDGTEIVSFNFDVIGSTNDDVPLAFEFSQVPPQVVVEMNGCALTDPIFEDGEIQVGTNDFKNIGLQIDIIPNPIAQNENAFLNIESEKSQDLTIQIFDTTSKLISENQLQIPSGKTNFELQKPLTSGVYFVRITTSENIIQTLRMIVL